MTTANLAAKMPVAVTAGYILRMYMHILRCHSYGVRQIEPPPL